MLAVTGTVTRGTYLAYKIGSKLVNSAPVEGTNIINTLKTGISQATKNASQMGISEVGK